MSWSLKGECIQNTIKMDFSKSQEQNRNIKITIVKLFKFCPRYKNKNHTPEAFRKKPTKR